MEHSSAQPANGTGAPVMAQREKFRKRAEDCTEWIEQRERYVEYIGEVPLYCSGSHHCLKCADAFMMTRIENGLSEENSQ